MITQDDIDAFTQPTDADVVKAVAGLRSITQEQFIRDTIEKWASIIEVSLDTEITLVEDYNHKPKIPKSVRGIYVIFTNEQILYLGKGWVVDRQWSHAQKLTGEFKGANDTSNWAEFRRTIGIQDLTNIKLLYVPVKYEYNITALEGILIKQLQPLANDEIMVPLKVR